jgi:hypothetical protein
MSTAVNHNHYTYCYCFEKVTQASYRFVIVIGTLAHTLPASQRLLLSTYSVIAHMELQVQVELWDARTMLHNGLPMDDPPRGPYNITVMLKGVGVAEMNAGSQPVIGVSDVLDKPGKTIIEIPCPRTRTTAAVHLDVITKNGLHFEDEFVLSFHMHFHKLLKWLIALPLLAMASVAVIVAQSYGFDVGKSPDRIV